VKDDTVANNCKSINASVRHYPPCNAIGFTPEIKSLVITIIYVTLNRPRLLSPHPRLISRDNLFGVCDRVYYFISSASN